LLDPLVKSEVERLKTYERTREQDGNRDTRDLRESKESKELRESKEFRTESPDNIRLNKKKEIIRL